MRKLAFLLGSLSLLFSIGASPVQAAGCEGTASGFGGNVSPTANSHTITFDLRNYQNQDLVLGLRRSQLVTFALISPKIRAGQNGTFPDDHGGEITIHGNLVTWVIRDERFIKSGDSIEAKLHEYNGAGWHLGGIALCDIGKYQTAKGADIPTGQTSCQVEIWQQRDGKNCYLGGENSCMSGGGTMTYIKATGLKNEDGTPFTGIDVHFVIGASGSEGAGDVEFRAVNGSVNAEFRTNHNTTYSILMRDGHWQGRILCPEIIFEARATGICESLCNLEPTSAYTAGSEANFALCAQVSDPEAKSECVQCVGGDGGEKPLGMWTAIGCIPIESDSIIRTIITLGLGIGGGITLLLILAGAFQLTVSSGEAQKVQEAREQITSAVIGLLFIIFSITILRFIGVQFLQLPGFGGQ